MTMRKVGIWGNYNKEDALKAARGLIDVLYRHEIEVCVEEQLHFRLNDPRAERGISACDVIVSLGGDGTLLAAMQYARRLDVPMLGVNLGHLGFLTEIEPEDIEVAVARLAVGDFTLDERMMLQVKGSELCALNEVTVIRAPSSRRILTLAVYVDGRLTQHFAGDGLIVATPTGSTGYSMSAGGAIVSPGVDLMLLTPVCAHTPHAKPIIVPASSRVEIVLQEDCEAALSLDGRCISLLKSGQHAIVYRAGQSARFIRMGGEQFFERLKSKLLDWGR
jgi:NAD+ kinase